MEEFDDTQFVALEHERLIGAVSKLDKTQHISEPTRNEPTNINSEFNLIKGSNKLDLINVARVLEDTDAHVTIGKKLKKTHDPSRILQKPLEKPQAERIKRATGYDATKKKIGRWDPVVARSRTVDFVSFPLPQHVSTKPRVKHNFVSKLKLKSSLEKELDEIDPPMVVESEEEEHTYPMSYEEMVEHRQHIAKLRAQESYKAAKAKRQSKIKSKKYHRVLKKEKLKQQLKEFEELQKTNPEEALKKLEVLEKARALERHTLRHKNTGKWAKNKLIRAKYDKEVRQQLAEQLAVSRSLTQKSKNVDSSSDDEVENTETIPDIALSQDPMNPWMLKRSDKSNVDAEFDFGYKKYLKDKTYKHQESDSESSNGDENDDNSQPLSVVKNHLRRLCQEDKEAIKHKVEDLPNIELENVNKNQSDEITKLPKNRKLNKNSSNCEISKLTSTSNWIVEPINKEIVNTKVKPIEDVTAAFDSLENDISKQVEAKLKVLRAEFENLNNIKKSDTNIKPDKRKHKEDNLEYLKFKSLKQKAIIDEALIETTSITAPESISVDKLPNIVSATQNDDPHKLDSNIDPNKFIEVKPKYLNTALPGGENDIDQLDDDEQVVPKVNIEDVFEEDDVVASFRQEKDNEINKNKLEEVNLSLPGWGSWGGKGVKAPRRKKNRFITKLPPEMPRRDENKGDIIIKEYKDPKLSAHKVKDIPFPFNSVKDYEASIRAPLGNLFIPEKAHRNLIKPSVFTKAGTIIEPMNEEQLLVKRNVNFKNVDVLKLLAKK